jgi:hypothetical protein
LIFFSLLIAHRTASDRSPAWLLGKALNLIPLRLLLRRRCRTGTGAFAAAGEQHWCTPLRWVVVLAEDRHAPPRQLFLDRRPVRYPTAGAGGECDRHGIGDLELHRHDRHDAEADEEDTSAEKASSATAPSHELSTTSRREF